MTRTRFPTGSAAFARVDITSCPSGCASTSARADVLAARIKDQTWELVPRQEDVAETAIIEAPAVDEIIVEVPLGVSTIDG